MKNGNLIRNSSFQTRKTLNERTNKLNQNIKIEERGKIIDKKYSLDKKMFNNSIKIVHQTLKNLPREKYISNERKMPHVPCLKPKDILNEKSFENGTIKKIKEKAGSCILLYLKHRVIGKV